MHRSSDIKLSEAAPPAARLWSLLSSTLSALLPLSQETLMYVAEANGKVVGFIQASGQPIGLDLRRARVLQVLNLQVADEADPDEVAPALVQHLCNQALERGSLRLFVDRKSTRLNSSHVRISYAVFCLKKKKKYGSYNVLPGSPHRHDLGTL